MSGAKTAPADSALLRYGPIEIVNQERPRRPNLPTFPAPRTPHTAWNKSISPARDRLQSRLLVAALLALLLPTVCVRVLSLWPAPAIVYYAAISAVFAALALLLRAATAPAALAGGLVCLALCSAAKAPTLFTVPRGLLALITLFVLTTLATRFGRARKQRLGLAEAHKGRRTSQVLANLGIAAVASAAGLYPCAVAALAEAAADTVSSEIGQALGGPVWMISTLRPVAPGTDGGVSLRGTAAGVLAALLVTITGVGHASVGVYALCFGAGVAGLLFDSVLGATLERRGLLGNDVVNLASTLFAAIIPWIAFALGTHSHILRSA